MSEIVGNKAYRFDQNPQEKIFHDKFKEVHIDAKYGGNIDFIAFPPREDGSLNYASDTLSDREKTIMLSTIQWLGSPVGQGFLRECGFEKIKVEEPKEEVEPGKPNLLKRWFKRRG